MCGCADVEIKVTLRMPRSILLLLLLIVFTEGFGQVDSTTPVYLRFPTLPEFTVYKAPDSSLFSRDDLQKKPTVFILFSPDCEHCQHETAELIKNIDQFKKVQILMVTYMPYDSMMAFYRHYNIAAYPNIIMARDSKYILPIFFDLKQLPSIFIYNKKGKLKKAFSGSTEIKSIIEEL